MSPSIPWGRAFDRYSFRLFWRFEMKKESLMSFCMLLSKYLGTRLCSSSLTSHWACPLSTLYPGELGAEPNGGCSLERCGTAEGWRSSIRWVKGLLRYESSTLILCKELSSPIFQSLSVIRQSVRHPWHLSRSPLCAIYKGITRLTYNCAHLRSTKESLTDSVKKKICAKIFLCENFFGWKFVGWTFFEWTFLLVKFFG